MYLVRLDLKTGSQRVLTFRDIERGKAAADLLANARLLGTLDPPKPNEWHIADDAGRELWGSGTSIAMVQFVDLELEVMVDTSTRALAHSIEQRVLAESGLVERPAPNGRAPEPTRFAQPGPDYEEPPAQPVGAIGRKASFAS